MSLISDALKEAQRERSERASLADRATPSAARTLFSSSSRPKKHWAIPVWVVVAAVGVALLGPMSFVLVRARLRRPATVASATETTAAVHPTTSKPSVAIKPPTISTPHAAVDTSLRATSPAAVLRTAVKTPPQSTASRVSAIASYPESAPRIGATASHTEPAAQPAAPRRTPAVASRAESSSNAPGIAALQPAPVAQSGSPGSSVRVVLDPSNVHPGDSVFAQAYAEQTRGNFERAADLYERALQIKPVSPQLYNDYGALLASRGNQTAAIAMYNLGLKSDERDPNLWTNIGDSYKAIGRHADAMSAYAEAAKLDPLNASLKTRLAGEYAAIGDTASAHRDYDAATHLAPRDPAVHHAYGVFLQAQHDYRGAMHEFQLFVDSAPGKFSQETIDAVKAHIARLARLTA